MARVTPTDDPDAPLALIVDNNPMTRQRLRAILTQRDFQLVEADDGDRAVDLHMLHEPDVVFISLDIPTIDGHVAALEIREMDPHGRIVFLAPKRLREVAEDATFSAGAVAWLEKPLTRGLLEANWEAIEGPIPAAPGLADLDSLYPDLEPEVAVRTRAPEPEPEVLSAPVPTPSELGLPAPPAPALKAVPRPPVQSKRSGRGRVVAAMFLFAVALGLVAWLLLASPLV